MGGRSESSSGAPHPLTVAAVSCFIATIAFAGVRHRGLDAVMAIEVGPTMAFVSAKSGSGSTVAEPAGRGVPAGSPLSTGQEPGLSSSKMLPMTAIGQLLDEPSRGSAVPNDTAPRSRPIGLTTSAFEIGDIPIRAVGIEADGQLEVPNETEIGWYQYGSTSGQPGATVLAAHVSWNGATGPFYELETLDPGSRVEVSLDDGTTHTYEVIERTMYEKDQLPRERIWRNTGPETLVLITCGGDFNPEIRRFQHNVVVYAVPVD